MAKKVPAVVFRIYERSDGKFEARSPNPKDSPLGVDRTLDLAMGSARREATMLSRGLGCAVIIETFASGKWKETDLVKPPRN